MSNQVYILNGPNLNLLGRREPEIYGSTRLSEIEQKCHEVADQIGLKVTFRQSNHEGVLVDWIQEACDQTAAIIINPAGYTTSSIAILDALKMSGGPIIELHLANIYKRETYYHNSKISIVADGIICGLGPYGYEAAIRFVGQNLNRL